MAEWKIEKNYIVGQDGEFILRIDQCCSYASPIKPEHAAQIVREHNSHDALVKAIRRHKDIFTTVHGNIGWDANYADMDAALALEEVNNG